MFATLVKFLSIGALVMTAMFWSSAAAYQLLLAFVVCLSAIVVAQQAVAAGRYLWAAGFASIAVLFNPVVLVFRPSGIWSLLIVLICTAGFAASVTALKTRPILSVPSITDRNPRSESL